jgi:hypothetical protein
MRWGVPDGVRDPATGELVHDDHIVSAALCSVLDEQTWGLTFSEIIPGKDPLSGLKPVGADGIDPISDMGGAY